MRKKTGVTHKMKSSQLLGLGIFTVTGIAMMLLVKTVPILLLVPIGFIIMMYGISHVYGVNQVYDEIQEVRER